MPVTVTLPLASTVAGPLMISQVTVPVPEPPVVVESSEPLLTLLSSTRQGMTAGEVAAHFGWSLEEARKALEQLFSTGALRKRSSRYRLKN